MIVNMRKHHRTTIALKLFQSVPLPKSVSVGVEGNWAANA